MTNLANPFRVMQPFEMSTTDLQTYWVQHHFYENLLRPEHCFVYGPPGIGKSMLFRHLMPDVQQSVAESQGETFFGLHVPLRGRSFTQGAWTSLDRHPLAFPLAEHILVTYVVLCLFEQLIDERYASNEFLSDEPDAWNRAFKDSQAAWRPSLRTHFGEIEDGNRREHVSRWLAGFKDLYGQGHESALACLADSGRARVTHPMASFDDLTAFLRALLSSKAIQAKRFYLLFDDVDDLTTAQALALNSWIARRHHDTAVVKCNSEGRYRSYRTMGERRILDPHDFYEIRLSSIYSREAVNNYEKFLEGIVNKRFVHFGIPHDARTYFPGDQHQDRAIEELAAKIRSESQDPSRAYAAGDKAYRIAESEFIKDLRRRRQLPTYRYAGFSVLADISSNVARHFLTTASDMFTQSPPEVRSKAIPVAIQDAVVRKHAEELVFDELGRLRADESDPLRKRELEGLEKLVLGVGMKCKSRLFSEATERRVFSFALQDSASVRLQAILDAGVQFGFFQVGSISDKEGLTRRRLYVLTRRVAPFFSLIVRSYSGYLSLKSSELERMLDLPIEQLRGFCKDPEETEDVDHLLEYQASFAFDLVEEVQQ